MKRRTLLATAPLALALAPSAQAADFTGFLSGLGARARQQGVPNSIIDQALGGLTPNQRVIHLDGHQPEFTLTWAQYSARVVTEARIRDGQAKRQQLSQVLAAIRTRFGVAADPIMGIWGIETDFGVIQGNFQVIDSLATLAWFRQSPYFGNEAIAAMKIAARGDAPLPRLIGSWAGAMGQPQFMPSVYLTTAVNFTGRGTPNIWTNVPDTMASIANYLHKARWVPGLPSSEPVLIPPGFNAGLAGRQHRLPLARWQALGVHRLANAARLSPTTEASLLLPDGPTGAAYLAYANFESIRRYNPSDLYALAVGELGRSIAA
ncbi:MULTISPECIES: lytic murein transglycosylase [Acidiphilium]|uniref:Membrane-bound lytic murein transglycosylase B n=1 Tax=Acidiphilium rubrum TaxID=526 RepID=A0A8G2CLP5_ACIRU|nr:MULTISPECIES: lytic murein transglycosylase [Acidiphilium]SIR06409.1 membrane-bound lytic murein transglycosylase B [Acidiphilium rubrum]